MGVYKHHLYGTRIYEIWRAMKKRCYLKTHIHYNNYGGRGITVCPEWKDNVKAFNDWAINNGYRDDLSIDRIDNNKGYCPENCRWATAKEQCRNTSKNHIIEYKGETHILTDWSKIIGISVKTMCERFKRGWTIEQVLTTPIKQKDTIVKIKPQRHAMLYEYKGVKKTFSQLSKELGIPESTIRNRAYVGRPIDCVKYVKI